MFRFDINTAAEIYWWAKSKRNEIEQAFHMKGGWEAWFQVELALWLKNKEGVASVVREQHVYSDESLAVDLMVTTTENVRNMIELKCESVNQDCKLKDSQYISKNAFRGVKYASPLIPSIAKRLEVECGRSDKVAVANRPYQYTVIGVSLTKEAYDFVHAEHDRDKLYFLPITSQKVSGQNADPNDRFVLWYKSYLNYL